MPVSNARYNDLKTRYERKAAELAAHKAADKAETRSLTKPATHLDTLKRIVAGHITHLERSALTEHASPLRAQLADADIDIAIELDRSWKPGPDALPATRTFTPEESRLFAELHRRTKAYAALGQELLDLQRINEVQARQLREHAEREGAAS